MEINKKIIYNTITDQEKIQIRPISTRDILRTRATMIRNEWSSLVKFENFEKSIHYTYKHLYD